MPQARDIIRRYVGFQFFFNLLLWIPVFYEAQKLLGLSDPQIFGIQSIYYVVFCFLEVPTGYIADRFGYRFSMLLGAAVLIGANLLPIAAANYGGFLAHFLAIALARSLISGAASAYLYESLKADGQAARYKKVEGDARFWSLVGRVVCWAGVGYLMQKNVFLPYWISAGNAALALGFALSLPDLGRRGVAEGAAARGPAATDATADGNLFFAIRSVLRSPLILLLMLQGVGIFVMGRVLQVNLYQPVLGAKGFDLTAFGWIMSLMTVFEAIGSKLSHRLKARISDLTAVTGATLVLCACLGLIALSGRAGTLVGFCLFSAAAGLAFPIQKQVLNDAVVNSRFRATILSMESIMDRALCALAVLPLGGLVKAGRTDETLLVCGVSVAGAALLVLVLVRRAQSAAALPGAPATLDPSHPASIPSAHGS